MPTAHNRGLALVTGATGYIGCRLVPRLLEDGWRVRVLTRDVGRLASRPWHAQVDIVEGDATSRPDLDRACLNVDVAYYLVHSMDGRPGFVDRDRHLAQHFAAAASGADVGRIVYLSGLHPAGVERLSAHLASRVEVGEVLMASGVPTAVLQAAVILGSGSASFEMLRHLTHRLPLMMAPRWLNNRIQPIGIGDVLHFLASAATLPSGVHRTFDIGGPDVLTYRQMIERFARLAGLRRRLVVTVPVLTPRLASYWVGFVTPVPTGLVRPLVGSLIHEVVCAENDLTDLVEVPAGGLTDFDTAVRAALADEPERRPEPGTVDPARITAADPSWAGR
ncbi:NAD(P)H-binding protein [Leekyejoonella antrihumi]|uniref:NAD-dependent epimerase/dehydratase family protein n=1 Tax=Leekyejoonella antrihumi TaxID=1660198 RepID=A0A563DZD2_9MICO|nr:NAD(P)H-binding protein [Leekyejoonella antrihumi]TWP35555.1 NAD-dependent epimerase/dehydratase family protein [Leekyejoonella antrihumi]